jgi:hypothetical protein
MAILTITTALSGIPRNFVHYVRARAPTCGWYPRERIESNYYLLNHEFINVSPSDTIMNELLLCKGCEGRSPVSDWTDWEEPQKASAILSFIRVSIKMRGGWEEELVDKEPLYGRYALRISYWLEANTTKHSRVLRTIVLEMLEQNLEIGYDFLF